MTDHRKRRVFKNKNVVCNCSGRFPAITSTDHLWRGNQSGPHSPLCGSESGNAPSTADSAVTLTPTSPRFLRAVTKVVCTVHGAALSQETPLPHRGLCGPLSQTAASGPTCYARSAKSGSTRGPPHPTPGLESPCFHPWAKATLHPQAEFSIKFCFLPETCAFSDRFFHPEQFPSFLTFSEDPSLRIQPCAIRPFLAVCFCHCQILLSLGPTDKKLEGPQGQFPTTTMRPPHDDNENAPPSEVGFFERPLVSGAGKLRPFHRSHDYRATMPMTHARISIERRGGPRCDESRHEPQDGPPISAIGPAPHRAKPATDSPPRGQSSLPNGGNRHAVRATTTRLYSQSIFGTSTQRRSLHDFRPSSASWTPLAPWSKFQGNGSPLTTCFRKSSHCTLKALS
ncbi:MAG: hypothetical protein RL077_5257 [Verrucomicrobiota bacterium]